MEIFRENDQDAAVVMVVNVVEVVQRLVGVVAKLFNADITKLRPRIRKLVDVHVVNLVNREYVYHLRFFTAESLRIKLASFTYHPARESNNDLDSSTATRHIHSQSTIWYIQIH